MTNNALFLVLLAVLSAVSYMNIAADDSPLKKEPFFKN